MTPWIQIAGVRDAAEAAMLAGEGVEWLGFPLRLAYHKEDCSDEAAAAIIRSLPPRCRGVLITYLDRAADIAALCAKLGARSVQLHGEVRRDEVRRLRDAGTYFVMKSLVVEAGNEDALRRRLDEYAPLVDAFITDTFDPATGARGATGKTHDWGVSRRLVEVSPKPVILAGGLNPDNVARAIREVRPAGVDAHTGVEGADGRKDRELVRRFVAEARKAFAAAAPA